MSSHGLEASHGYWCECTSLAKPDTGASTLRAYFDAQDAAQAVRWIRVTLRTLASTLDGEAFEQAWSWITHDHQTALRDLRAGHSYALTLHHQAAEITWTVRPVIFLPLAHRQAGALPPCTEWFSTAQLPHQGRE